MGSTLAKSEHRDFGIMRLVRSEKRDVPQVRHLFFAIFRNYKRSESGEFGKATGHLLQVGIQKSLISYLLEIFIWHTIKNTIMFWYNV